MKDRPFMTTCVPKSLYLNLTDITVVYGANWSGGDHFGLDTENQVDVDGSRFDFEHRIVAKAKLDHDITVFRVPEGEVKKFKEIAFVTIRADRSGTIGGIQRATTITGISYSGMSSREVPEQGLMEGEPGSLYYVDATDDKYDRELGGQRYLGLELYMPKEQFERLIENVVSSSLPIKGASAYTNIELFEYEVDASLSEPWHRHDYGLIQHGRSFELTSSRARLHTLSFFFSTPPIQSESESDDGEDVVLDPIRAAVVTPAEDTNEELTATVRKYGKFVIAVGVAILIVLLAK